MPDTFTPDQFSQTQTVPPVSGATPCAKSRGAVKKVTSKSKRPTATPSANGADAVELRWREMKALQTIVDTEGDVDEGPKLQAYHAATNRFLKEPVSSLLGVQRKLEHLCEIEAVEPRDSLMDSIILGLVQDLRQVSTQQSAVTMTAPTSDPGGALRAVRDVIYDASCEIEYRTGTIDTGLELAGSLLDKLCHEIHSPDGPKRDPIFLALINQIIFVLDSIRDTATQIQAESDKVYRASLETADAGIPCSNS